MASDKYDAFPQAIIILLLDLFLVCRWQQPQRCMPRLHSGKEREKKGAVETQGHRLERYKRVYGEAERNQNQKRRTANSRVCFASSPSAPPYLTLSFSLSLSLSPLFLLSSLHCLSPRALDNRVPTEMPPPRY